MSHTVVCRTGPAASVPCNPCCCIVSACSGRVNVLCCCGVVSATAATPDAAATPAKGTFSSAAAVLDVWKGAGCSDWADCCWNDGNCCCCGSCSCACDGPLSGLVSTMAVVCCAVRVKDARLRPLPLPLAIVAAATAGGAAGTFIAACVAAADAGAVAVDLD